MNVTQVFYIVAAVLFGCAGLGLPYGNLVAWGLFFAMLGFLLTGRI